MNLFESTSIRSCNDISSGKHWFSAIDICAAIKNCDYQTARNYWKWLKSKLFTSQPVSVTNQLKMQAQDGKLRYTDVLDIAGVLKIIQLFPGQRANAFRVWIAGLIEEKKPVMECLEEAVLAAKDMIRSLVGDLLKTTRMVDICLFDEKDCVVLNAD